jgi:succinate dehydrogenase assembly factor 2
MCKGILETDLILSTFAKDFLPKADIQALKQYDTLLEENDWDIYYWCTVRFIRFFCLLY